jgi:hypothetical protein
MREYRAKRSTLVFTLGFLGVLTLLTILGVFFAEPRLFFVAFLLVLAWRWYQILKTPVKIQVEDDDTIEFRGLIGRVVLSPDRINRIMRVGRGYWVEYPEGSLNVYGNMEGLEDFLAYLKSANPALEVKPFTWLQQR